MKFVTETTRFMPAESDSVYFATRIELVLKTLFDAILGYYTNKRMILNSLNVLNLNFMQKAENTKKRLIL